MKQLVVILGIDRFVHKNIYQMRCLNKNDFKLVVFSNNKELSDMYIKYPNEHYLLEKTLYRRTKQILKYLSKNDSLIHHVEIYPGGRFSPIYLFLSLLCKLKVIVVERGDLIYWNEYNYLYKKWLSILYKNADLVWFREPYMKNILNKIGTKRSFFLHNCIEEQKNLKLDKNKDIDFLWVNRFIKERKIDWVIKAAKKYNNKKFVFVGILKNAKANDILYNQFKLIKLQLPNVEIYDFQDPIKFYIKAKFFVLPSDIVFLNNSLLESMSFGVVPIISNVSGSKEIVINEVNGFICENTEKSFLKIIDRAINLNEKDYMNISMNTLKTVTHKFSCEKKWCLEYISMIKKVI